MNISAELRVPLLRFLNHNFGGGWDQIRPIWDSVLDLDLFDMIQGLESDHLVGMVGITPRVLGSRVKFPLDMKNNLIWLTESWNL